jgi:hypothetical protein
MVRLQWLENPTFCFVARLTCGISPGAARRRRKGRLRGYARPSLDWTGPRSKFLVAGQREKRATYGARYTGWWSGSGCR